MESAKCSHCKKTMYSAYLPRGKMIRCIYCGKEFSMAKKKKVKRATRRVDEDWEALKRDFAEAGKKAARKFYQDPKNEILLEAQEEAEEMERLREEQRK